MARQQSHRGRRALRPARLNGALARFLCRIAERHTHLRGLHFARVQIRKVMLVDDEPDILTVGELALQDVGGWEVCLAESGAEALELFEQERPDVVLLDVMMPRMDGPTTFQRLRDKNLDGRAVVIFMTAKVQTYEVQRYLELGAAGVIAKPFDPVSLPEEIREIVRTRSA